MWDVLIAGAGPAGSITATILARAGLRVLLLDRARFPRDKLCGDSLNPGTVALLQRLDLSSWIEAHGIPIDGMLVTGPGGVRVEGRYPPGLRGYTALRRDLDDWLLREAIRAGAQFDEGVAVRRAAVADTGGERRADLGRTAGAPGQLRVTGLVVASRSRTGEVTLPARVTVAADGRRSTVAFGLGLARHPHRPRRWAIGAYFEGVSASASVGEMHIRAGEYIGVAPLTGGLTNVCLVTAGSRLQANSNSCVTASTPGVASGFSSRVGSGSSAHVDPSFSAHVGSGVSARVGSGVSSRVESGFSSDVGSDFGSHAGSGFGSHVGSDFGSHAGSGFGSHVGSGFSRTSYARSARDPESTLRAAIDRDPVLRERFAAARMVTRPVVLGPLAVESTGAAFPGLLLAGDAAGFIDPMTGDGLRFAVRGAELAAEAALENLATGRADAHMALAERRRRAFEWKWRFNRTLRRIVDMPAAVNAAAFGASVAPGLLRLLISVAGDCHDPRQAATRM